MAQALIKVTGKVQGVFYRARTRDEAKDLGLTGYARNLPDGSVEILVVGKESGIEQLAEWCRTGSPHCRVDSLSINWLEEGEHKNLSQPSLGKDFKVL